MLTTISFPRDVFSILLLQRVTFHSILIVTTFPALTSEVHGQLIGMPLWLAPQQKCAKSLDGFETLLLLMTSDNKKQANHWVVCHSIIKYLLVNLKGYCLTFAERFHMIVTITSLWRGLLTCDKSLMQHNNYFLHLKCSDGCYMKWKGWYQLQSSHGNHTTTEKHEVLAACDEEIWL